MDDLVLEAIEGPAAGKTFELTGPVELGREAGLTISVDDDEMSRHHARVTPADPAAVVEDLGSTNGTFVNGRPLHGRGPLAVGDQLRAGLSVFELQTREGLRAQGSAVRAVPQLTKLSADVLKPAKPGELAPVAAAEPQSPGLLAPEREPAFVPQAARDLAAAQSDPRATPDVLSGWVDSRVKQQTTVAAFAILAVAAILLVIFIGLR